MGPYNGKISIDGKDLSMISRKVTVELGVDGLPIVTIEFIGADVEFEADVERLFRAGKDAKA